MKDIAKPEMHEWCCDGVEIFKNGCKSGQKDLGKHPGILCWRCVESHPEDDNEEEGCDFDLCEDCLRWVTYCAETGTDLGAHEGKLRNKEENKEAESGEVKMKKRLSVIPVNIHEDLTQSSFWKTQKLEKMNLVGDAGAETNFQWPTLAEMKQFPINKRIKLNKIIFKQKP